MTAPNNDPMTRIADALELIAVVQSRDSDGYATDSLRERILAQYTVPTVTVPVLPTTPEGNALVDELLTRKPAPTTADVLGSELRVGDVVVDYHRGNGMWLHWRGSPRVGDLAHWAHGYTYRVRLPRPAVEPSAKTKCGSCRCMIVPGAACACCVSTSGDDPQLPSLDLDEEPSASGEGIARLRHELLEIGAHSWAVGELHDQPLLMASRIVSAVNDTHAHATRELRERCERAERERDEAHKHEIRSASGEGIATSSGNIVSIRSVRATTSWELHDEGDARWHAAEINLAHAHATRELQERCERAERDAAKWERVATEGDAREFGRIAETEAAFAERDTAIARAELAERVVQTSEALIAAWHDGRGVPSYALDAVDLALKAARKDGGK